MGRGKGKQTKIRKAAQHNKQLAQAHATETAEAAIIISPVPPVPPAVPDKAPNWFQRNQIATSIIVAIGAIVATELYHWSISGPKISLKIYDYLQHFHKIGEGNERENVIMIPATILNTGDKKYFIDLIKCEIKIGGNWVEIHPTDVDSLDDLHYGTKDSLNFINMPNINANVSVGGDDELQGRFIFKTESVNIVSSAIHECRFTLIDRDEQKLVILKDLNKVEAIDEDDYYRHVGIKRKPTKIN